MSKLCRCLAFVAKPFVFFDDSSLTEYVAGHKQAIAWLFDLHTAKHLSDNHLEVLVGNVLTLSSVDTQDFIDHVALSGFDTLEAHQLV